MNSASFPNCRKKELSLGKGFGIHVLITVVLLVLAGIASILLLTRTLYMRNYVRENARAQMEREVEIFETSVDEELEAIENAIVLLESGLEFWSPEVQPLLDHLIEIGSLHQIRYIDADYNKYNRDGTIKENIREAGKDYFELCREVMEGRREIGIFYDYSHSAGDPRIRFMLPVERNGEITGIISVSMLREELEKRFVHEYNGGFIYTFLVDAEGHVILTDLPGAELEEKQTLFDTEYAVRIEPNAKITAEVRNAVADCRDIYYQNFRTANREACFIVIAPVSLENWKLVMIGDVNVYQTVFGQIKDTYSQCIYCISGVMILVFLLSLTALMLRIRTGRTNGARVVAELSAASEQLDTTEKQLSAAEKQLSAAKDQLIVVEEKLETTQDELETTQDELVSVQDRLESPQNLLEHTEYRLIAGQLKPHFLYNTLAAIREVMLDDPQYASELLVDFTTFLRANIRETDSEHTVPFSTELTCIRAYVNIEKLRFGDRLKVIFEIGTEDFDIMPLSIQPLVENSIRHGIFEKRGADGFVRLSTEDTGAEIVITVEDNGVGFDAASVIYQIEKETQAAGGFRNSLLLLKKRMGAAVEVESAPNEGSRIRITLPKQ